MSLEVRLFFHARPEAERLFHRLRDIVGGFGPTELAATKSRVSFIRRTRFLWVHEANLDGSIWIGFNTPWPLGSDRLRSGARGNVWSHHAKIRDENDLDPEMVAWLRGAYDADALEEA